LDDGTYSNIFVDDTGVYLFQDSASSTSPSTYPYVDLYFSDASPISEASLCTDASVCGAYVSQVRDTDGFFDLTGTNATTTPEPGSFLLLASGLVGLGLLVRKQGIATN
jgi:hypothetical protein